SRTSQLSTTTTTISPMTTVLSTNGMVLWDIHSKRMPMVPHVKFGRSLYAMKRIQTAPNRCMLEMQRQAVETIT
ncbi:MAG: hypothetical protein ACK55Z_19115, partial [bacterium]